MAALRLAMDVRRHDPAVILVNTHAGALIAAKAAMTIPDLGSRCFLFVRDYMWENLDHIFGRLGGARVLVPHRSVAERNGYLAPFHIGPGAASWTESPDMVEISDVPVSFDGPMLHLATVNPWKGHADLMLAMERLSGVNPRLTVHSAGIIGNRALLDRLIRLAGRLDLGERFTLNPYAADPASLLATCRAVIVSSVSHSGGPESFGRTVIEAWAHGKPVIAYAAGAPAAIIEHERDGLLVPEGDIGALAEALDRFDRSPDLAQRLGAAGHAKTRRHYEAGAVTHRLLETLGVAP
jgi:glycosyltransferase involved in cell wall biosynthesis